MGAKKFSFVGDQATGGSSGSAVDMGGDPKLQKELEKIAPFMNVKAAGYQTAAEALKAYRSGQLKPSEVIDVTKSLNLVSEEQCLDMTPKDGIAVLEEASGDETEHDSTINEATGEKTKKVKGRATKAKKVKEPSKKSSGVRKELDKEATKDVVVVDMKTGLKEPTAKNFNYNQTPQEDEATTNEDQAGLTRTRKDEEENVQKKSKPRIYGPIRPRITDREEDQELDSKIVQTEHQLRVLREKKLADQISQVNEFKTLIKKIAMKDPNKANKVINELEDIVVEIMSDSTNVKTEKDRTETEQN